MQVCGDIRRLFMLLNKYVPSSIFWHVKKSIMHTEMMNLYVHFMNQFNCNVTLRAYIDAK